MIVEDMQALTAMIGHMLYIMENAMRTVGLKVLSGLCWIGLILPVQAAEPVSIESLLEEMVDRDAVACFPDADFRLKQHSSYNRASQTPDEPKGWFTNHDYNSGDKDHNFIRIEETNGQKAWVLMDHQGPGAIVRSWMPWHNPKNAGSDITMRIYLDGSDEPALEGNMLGLFNGSGVIPYPFAHPSLRSSVNFFPIPYAKSCKVTTHKRPFLFIFTFRESKGTLFGLDCVSLASAGVEEFI